MCGLFNQKKIRIFSKKYVFLVFFKENLILVGSLNVELDFMVLAPTSMYARQPSHGPCSKQGAVTAYMKYVSGNVKH